MTPEEQFFNILSQRFPQAFLIICVLGLLIFFIKSFVEIRSRLHASKINKLISKLTLGLVQSNKIEGIALSLQGTLNKIHDISSQIAEHAPSEFIHSNIEKLQKLISRLLEDWQYKPHVHIEKNDASILVEISQSLFKAAGLVSRDFFVQSSLSLRRLLEDLNSLCTEAETKVNQIQDMSGEDQTEKRKGIDKVAAIKSAGAFISILFCILGIYSLERNSGYLTDLKWKLSLSSKSLKETIGKNKELESLSERASKEIESLQQKNETYELETNRQKSLVAELNDKNAEITQSNSDLKQQYLAQKENVTSQKNELLELNKKISEHQKLL